MATRRATSKWRLPQDVTKVRDFTALQQPHLKTMLEFMGVSLTSQPKTKDDKARMLAERVSADPAKAQKAYDVIVWNKLPDVDASVTKDAEAMRAHFYSVMTDLLGSEQMDALRDKVAALADELRTKVEEYGRKAMAEAARNYRPVQIRQGTKKRTVKGVLPEEFDRIVQLCSQRVPVMLVGPAGCGKTYLAGKAAEALGLEAYDQSCSEGVSESTFVGWLLPVGASGKFEYVASPFVTAYENGGVFLLDEIDAADPNLLTFLNKAIANDYFFLPQRHRKPKVTKHKDFVVIAAANTFGHGADAEYVGRNALDAATLDRFRAGMINLDYSATVEEALVDSEVLTWGRRVRECIRRNGLRRIMSTRVMLDMSRMKENCDWTVADMERAYFADWSKDELAKWRGAA